MYRVQKDLPKEEVYSLGDQIRRAVVSIPSNIAEGFGRESDKGFRRFLAIARGSLYVTKTQLQFAESLGYLNMEANLLSLFDEVGSLMSSFSHDVINIGIVATSNITKKDFIVFIIVLIFVYFTEYHFCRCIYTKKAQASSCLFVTRGLRIAFTLQ